MYATQGVDRYTVIKIEQQDRLARAERRFLATADAPPPVAPPIAVTAAGIRRRAAVALVTFVLGLGLLAGAAAAQNVGTTSAASADGCVRMAGNRLLC
jgi:hypothetical protein